jgi:fumarate hydratase class I
MIRIDLPITAETIRELKVGDTVEIYGTMITGRDAAHAYLTKEFRPDLKEWLNDTFIYHCGPVVATDEHGNYSFVSAGPTTSIREERYQADVIRDYGVRGVIGKGGMGAKTLAACREHGCVYLHAIGGSGAITAKQVVKVHDVKMKDEFGVPEAFWKIEVEGFVCTVTMDAHGGSLHERIDAESHEVRNRLLGVTNGGVIEPESGDDSG